jgi:hypothetical protein
MGFLLSHHIQTGSEAHSLLLNTYRVLLPDGKVAGALDEN